MTDDMTTSCNNTLKIGNVLNQKWIILEYIDKGGMGEVYRAHQTNLNRDVAIKVISREWIESIDEGDEEAGTLVQRFRREVQSMAQIRHPNILQVYDHDSITINKCGKDIPVEYIAMEFIPGGSLRDTMSEEGYYPETDALNDWINDFFMPALVGVQALHEAGIVHRDLKPENILMDHGVPKIADFGLSRSHRLKPITRSIDVKGSPHYMSPEHFFDFKRADQRADVYSLGKILFEAVEGKIQKGTIPFKSVSLAETDAPYYEQLDRIINEATQEDRLKRTKSVKDLHEQLNALLSHKNSNNRSKVTEPKQSSRTLYNPKWIWSGIIFSILSIALMMLWHLSGQTSLPTTTQQQKNAIQFETTDKEPEPNSVVNHETTEHIGKQHLIPKGNLILPATLEGVNKDPVMIESFYMDEFLVTNQQFVDFMNHNLSRINLENGVVNGDGATWYLLGEVNEGYDPIIYRNKEFHVSDPAYASSPVLRVTGYGASAYASYYNRRLPTESEWLYAAIEGELNSQASKDSSTTNWNSMNMNDMMRGDWRNENWNMESMYQFENKNLKAVSEAKEPPSAAFFNKNKFSIRALNQGFGEWGLRNLSIHSKDKIKENIYIVMGALKQEKQGDSPPPVISRFPWEGFEEIGFRTVKTVSSEL